MNKMMQAFIEYCMKSCQRSYDYETDWIDREYKGTVYLIGPWYIAIARTKGSDDIQPSNLPNDKSPISSPSSMAEAA